jgi:hypothetical protein
VIDLLRAFQDSLAFKQNLGESDEGNSKNRSLFYSVTRVEK